MSDVLRVLSHVPLGLLEPVRAEHPDVELVEIPEEGPLPASAQGEIALTQAWGSPNMAEVMTRGVRWVHAYGTGVNDFPFATLGDAILWVAGVHAAAALFHHFYLRDQVFRSMLSGRMND